MSAHLHSSVSKREKGGGDDCICEFLTERNYLGALTLLVNVIKEEKEEEAKEEEEEKKEKNKKNLRARRKEGLWRSRRRIPTVRQRPNTKRYRDKREKRAQERVGSFSSTCRLHLFPYVYFPSSATLLPVTSTSSSL